MISSYNIHRCIGRDGRYDVGRVEKVLAEVGADVVALQEVSIRRRGPGAVDQAAHLASALRMYAVPGPTLRSHEGEIANAVLARSSPRRVTHVDLSQPGYEPRAAIDVELDVGASTLRVVATHLGLGWRERRTQAERLLEQLAPSSADVTVVLGDANEWVPIGGALQALHRTFGRAPAWRTFPSWLPVLPLDRIWVSPRERVIRDGVYTSRAARYASDHLPVYATLEWDGGPSTAR